MHAVAGGGAGAGHRWLEVRLPDFGDPGDQDLDVAALKAEIKAARQCSHSRQGCTKRQREMIVLDVWDAWHTEQQHMHGG